MEQGKADWTDPRYRLSPFGQSERAFRWRSANETRAVQSRHRQQAAGCDVVAIKVEDIAPNGCAIKVPVLVHETAPVLLRIAKCESSGQQFRDGQVLIHVNHDGTWDIGKYQINSIHSKKAAALGYDLATEAGNERYAQYLYANYGTGDWSASQACWRN